MRNLSKWAGGIGNDWTNIRGTGSMIKGIHATSQGVSSIFENC